MFTLESLFRKSDVLKLQFTKFKKFVSRSAFTELQLTQISFNFQTSYWNIKIRGLGTKLYVNFLLFLLWKKLWLMADFRGILLLLLFVIVTFIYMSGKVFNNQKLTRHLKCQQVTWDYLPYGSLCSWVRNRGGGEKVGK